MAPKAAKDIVELLSAADRDVLAESNRLQELAYEGVIEGSAMCMNITIDRELTELEKSACRSKSCVIADAFKDTSHVHQ